MMKGQRDQSLYGSLVSGCIHSEFKSRPDHSLQRHPDLCLFKPNSETPAHWKEVAVSSNNPEWIVTKPHFKKSY